MEAALIYIAASFVATLALIWCAEHSPIFEQE